MPSRDSRGLRGDLTKHHTLSKQAHSRLKEKALFSNSAWHHYKHVGRVICTCSFAFRVWSSLLVGKNIMNLVYGLTAKQLQQTEEKT